MRKKLSIKAGLDLSLYGAIIRNIITQVKPEQVAVVPDDYPGLTLKAAVKPGESVAAGAPLLYDKEFPDLKIVSPVSGTVADVVRGERRKILHIVVNNDGDAAPLTFRLGKTTEYVRKGLMECGLWAEIHQRPYDIVARPDSQPRDIFVTAFDTAPHAAPESMKVDPELLAEGVAVLKKFTKGNVVICSRASNPLPDIKGAEMVDVSGPHPAGNVGVHIANLAPVNKGETVWTLDSVTLENIGRVAATGKPSFKTLVAVTGPNVISPALCETVRGCEIAILTRGNLFTAHPNRFVSGNLFTGHNVGKDGFLRAPWRQVSVIEEGVDHHQFMGWASMSMENLSQNRSFPSSFRPHRENSPDARLHGSPRAMIMSGVYDRFIPMDIMPEFLIKAILSKNIEQMEALGIYEVAPEDFALAEYADPSKLELQKIVADGLTWLRKELM